MFIRFMIQIKKVAAVRSDLVVKVKGMSQNVASASIITNISSAIALPRIEKTGIFLVSKESQSREALERNAAKTFLSASMQLIVAVRLSMYVEMNTLLQNFCCSTPLSPFLEQGQTKAGKRYLNLKFLKANVFFAIHLSPIFDLSFERIENFNVHLYVPYIHDI